MTVLIIKIDQSKAVYLFILRVMQEFLIYFIRTINDFDKLVYYKKRVLSAKILNHKILDVKEVIDNQKSK